MKIAMRVIIVGMNPSKVRDGRDSATIKRLNSWVERLGLDFYTFTNCAHVPGVVKPSDVDYEFLSECVKPYDKVIALGGFASNILIKIGVRHFKMPHPSGLNRRLNDPAYEEDAIELCRRYLSE